MARHEIAKTDLAQRLRDARRQLGDLPREAFAQRLGLSPKTLANYERGDTQPDAAALASYRSAFALDTNWIVSGDGSMFGTTASRSVVMDDFARLKEAIELIEQGLAEAGRVATPDGKAEMISAAYEILKGGGAASSAQIIRLVKAS